MPGLSSQPDQQILFHDFAAKLSLQTQQPDVTDLQLFGVKIIDPVSNYFALFITLAKQ